MRPRVGWRIYSMIVGMGAIMYFQQKGVMIAAERIMPELSVSQMQIGWIQWAYLLAYTPGQILAGPLGQRFGARGTLTVAGLVAVLATIATPLAPLVLSGGAIFVGLFLSQLFLGFAQAPTFPIAAGVLRTWLPERRWAFANGFQSTGAQLGAAAAPAVLVFLMQRFGWQRALFWSALPPLGLVVLWAWYVRNTPREHASVSPQELADLEPQTTLPMQRDALPMQRDALPMQRDALPTQRDALPMRHRRLPLRDLALLTASYTSMNYVFYLLGSWSFLYLIQERHFTVAQSGVLASLPPLAAALGAGVGGGLTDLLCLRLGLRWGYRLVPLISLSSVALLLLLAVYVAGPVLAVVAMTLSYGMLELNEGAYWAATMQIAGANTMTAGGVLNTGGSLGGLIGIPIVAFLSGHGQWHLAFLIGAACALMSALSWLAIDAGRDEPCKLAG